MHHFFLIELQHMQTSEQGGMEKGDREVFLTLYCWAKSSGCSKTRALLDFALCCRQSSIRDAHTAQCCSTAWVCVPLKPTAGHYTYLEPLCYNHSCTLFPL